MAVPPKAEYEAGFLKWVEHFCRLGSTLGCRVHFYANEETTAHLQGLVKAKYGQTLTDFSRLDDWGDLLILTGQVNFDHLLVIISAAAAPSPMTAPREATGTNQQVLCK